MMQQHSPSATPAAGCSLSIIILFIVMLPMTLTYGLVMFAVTVSVEVGGLDPLA